MPEEECIYRFLWIFRFARLAHPGPPGRRAKRGPGGGVPRGLARVRVVYRAVMAVAGTGRRPRGAGGGAAPGLAARARQAAAPRPGRRGSRTPPAAAPRPAP